MKKYAALIGLLVLFVIGVGGALAIGGESTGTVSACATVTAPLHTVGVDGAGVATVGGDVATHCETVTYTIPTSTVTKTVTVTEPAPTSSTTTTAPPPTTTTDPAPSSPRPMGVPGDWTLAFDDEFDGSSLDLTKWAPCWYPLSYGDPRGTSDSCGSMNKVTTYKHNVSVGNGALTLRLESTTAGALIDTDPKWGAKPGYAFTTGVVEARAYFPGSGSTCYDWPGFWTNGQSWPSNGEHDIAEVLGGKMTVNYHSASGSHNQGAVPGSWCDGYHVFTLHRQVGKADVYFDGVKVKSYTTDDAEAPQYLVLNIGANGVIQVPAELKVDYVRAWK